MSTLNLSLQLCLQLQAELNALPLNQQQPALSLLQSQIKSFLLSAVVSSSKSGSGSDSKSVSGKKRTASKSMDMTGDKTHAKKVLKSGRLSARNDSRKRAMKNLGTVKKSFLAKKKQDKDTEIEEEEEKESSCEEKNGENPYEEKEEEEENDNSADNLQEQEEEEEDVEAEKETPVRKKTRSRKPKCKPWEMVEDTRKLTDHGAKIIQSLACISEQSHLQSLSSLKTRLMSLSSNSAHPQKTTLESVLQRCITLDLNAIEDRFLHMVALIQLSLWLKE